MKYYRCLLEIAFSVYFIVERIRLSNEKKKYWKSQSFILAVFVCAIINKYNAHTGIYLHIQHEIWYENVEWNDDNITINTQKGIKFKILGYLRRKMTNNTKQKINNNNNKTEATFCKIHPLYIKIFGFRFRIYLRIKDQ